MHKIIIKENESLKNYCTFHIGGNAKKIVTVFSCRQLIEICQNSQENKEKFKVIGLGANLLFNSNGYDGNIIVNKSNIVRFYDNFVYVSSGTTIGELIKKCVNKNLSGLENFAGIPSTIGGAVTNNLGAFGAEISNFIQCVYCYKHPNLTKKIILNKDECNFGYRDSIFKSQKYLIVGVRLKLNKDNKSVILKRIKSAITKKSSSQPIVEYSAGSVFKRADVIPAKIIDTLGLKGKKIGGAQISTKHAGFIVNNSNATSFDVLKLIDFIKQEVKKRYNSDLELEIEIVD